jgi:Leucine-rich repeat (LRR) protein
MREEVVANSNFLSGTFPGIESNPFVASLLADPEILKSVSLKHIDLSDNDLSGSIPAWGGYLPTVEFMDFSNNKFTGRLPIGASLGAGPMLPGLETLRLSNNFFTGTFPKELPPNINLIDVSGNLLVGTLPTEISNFTNLNFLLLENNEFLNLDLGSLLRHAVHLKTLSARNTSLTGRFNGTDVKSLLEMEILDLGYNAITGTIPPEFGQLASMKNLVLQSNQLSGSIPSALGSLNELRILKLDNNRLSGSFPQTLGMLGRLEELSVAGNPQLSGSLPDKLCQSQYPEFDTSQYRV